MRGGARPGAGRKPLPPELRRKPVVVYVTDEMRQWLRREAGDRPVAHLAAALMEAGRKERENGRLPCAERR